jgi:hypothetical protein
MNNSVEAPRHSDDKGLLTGNKFAKIALLEGTNDADNANSTKNVGSIACH